ncbi:MAG: hypothetical protein ABSB01_11700 [Streptosporangiaceae bacterium]|jgi:hypothetical protein
MPSPAQHHRRWRHRTLAAATLTVLLAGGCGGGSATASKLTPTSARPIAPESPSPQSFATFAGTWRRHSGNLVIRDNGQFTISLRTYRWCSQNPPPCDSISGNVIRDGDNASGQLSSVSGKSATGQVARTTDQADTPKGRIIITLHTQTDIVYANNVNYCGPSSPVTACGA